MIYGIHEHHESWTSPWKFTIATTIDNIDYVTYMIHATTVYEHEKTMGIYSRSIFNSLEKCALHSKCLLGQVLL